MNAYFIHTIQTIFILSVFIWSSVTAQTTGNVYNSTINPGQQDIEYRTAFVPDDGNVPSRFANRLHYQNAFRNNVRWRGVLQGSDTRTGDMEFNFFQSEFLWQFRNRATHGWDSALRFDARLSDNNRADRIAINWSGQRNFAERWQTRAVVLLGRELGSQARSGATFETRERISYRLKNGNNVAVEMFNSFGRTPSFGSFQTQRHRIGPALNGRFNNNWTYNLGMLWGFSDAASKVDLRAALIKSF